MTAPWIAVLVLVVLLSPVLYRIGSRVLKVLLLRRAMRGALSEVGQQALAKQPDTISLSRTPDPQWSDAAAIEALARPLLGLGFYDCGAYKVDKMPGVKMRILMKEDTSMAAFLYEHPQAGTWIELSVRYEDGSTNALATLPATGIKSPEWFHTLRASKSEPTDQLYQRLLAERRQSGIKPVTRDTVVREYEEAYMRIMLWQKNRGLSLEEVATVARHWLEKKGAEP
jgi:hypothetical protein